MTYSEFIDKILPFAEKDFACFQRKLIFTDRKILGVRTPILRKLAKELVDSVEDLLSFPDEYYETIFITLTAVSLLPYEQFLLYVERCVALIDNWALCDGFKGKCIKKNKDAFLNVLEGLFNKGGEYFERYVFVAFLTEYVEEKYLFILKEYFPTIDLKRNIRRRSKGMQKQVAFWLAICCKPEVLILDEPVDGLDPVMRRQIWSILMAEVAEREMTVVVS